LIDKLTQQQRMILALALSFIFFMVYESFMPKPQMADLNQTKTNSQLVKDTKTINNTSAPQMDTTTNQSTINHSKSTNSLQQSQLSTVKSKDFIAKFDSLGRISFFELREKKFETKDGTYPAIISEENELLPLEIRFADEKINEEAFKTPYIADTKELLVDSKPNTITLTQNLSDLTVQKIITFEPNGHYNLKIKLSKDIPYFITNGTRPISDTDRYTFNGTLVKKADGKLDTIAEGDADESMKYNGANFVASSNKYYTTLFYDFQNGLPVVIDHDKEKNPLPFVKGSNNFKVNAYIGSKEYDTLKSIDPKLTDVIEYGFFTFISKPLFLALKYIHNLVGNWGWAIVIITILLRLILYPLTFKGMVSMNKMKELSPKVNEIRQKYKKDPQKMNAKMMELYKKHGANPMGGCLPMLLQIPVFFAIYRVLLNAVELKHAPWIGWIQDLSVMDPYYILPILMGATMFWQQRLTPSNFTDPMQEKIMKFLPLIFTFFFVTFPAGLTLYWFVNNLFSVAQQYYVNSIFDKQRKAKA